MNFSQILGETRGCGLYSGATCSPENTAFHIICSFLVSWSTEFTSSETLNRRSRAANFCFRFLCWKYKHTTDVDQQSTADMGTFLSVNQLHRYRQLNSQQRKHTRKHKMYAHQSS